MGILEAYDKDGTPVITPDKVYDTKIRHADTCIVTFSHTVLEKVLEEFSYEGETVMMAPASGFYTTPGAGINQVRIAYVLKKEDLVRALFVLEKALEQYPGRVE